MLLECISRNEIGLFGLGRPNNGLTLKSLGKKMSDWPKKNIHVRAGLKIIVLVSPIKLVWAEIIKLLNGPKNI